MEAASAFPPSPYVRKESSGHFSYVALRVLLGGDSRKVEMADYWILDLFLICWGLPNGIGIAVKILMSIYKYCTLKALSSPKISIIFNCHLLT